jgi:hypothetical protein
MNTGNIIGGLLFLGIGVAQLFWPRKIWALENVLWVKGGERTDFALMMIYMSGIVASLVGLFLIFGTLAGLGSAN